MGDVARKRGFGDQLDDLGRGVVHDLYGVLQWAGLVEESAVLATNIGGLRGPEESATMATGRLILQRANVDGLAPHLR